MIILSPAFGECSAREVTDCYLPILYTNWYSEIMAEDKDHLIRELENVAVILDGYCQSGVYDPEHLDQLQSKFEKTSNKLFDVDRITQDMFVAYEVQALLDWLRGHSSDAYRSIAQAQDLRGDTEMLTQTGFDLAEAYSYDSEKEKYDSRGMVGIGGWLLVFCIWLVIAIVVNVYGGLQQILPLIRGYDSDILQYPNLAAAVYVEGAMAILFGLAGVYLFYEIIMRHSAARTVAVWYLSALVLFSVIDVGFVWLLFAWSNDLANEIFGYISDEIGRIITSSITAIIWIVYFVSSRRVKFTLDDE